MTVPAATAPKPPVGAAAPTPAGAIPSNPKGALGKDQFLQLLGAQMKSQDPLSPMDGQQMAAQLAQFSSVEQLVQLNDTIQAQSAAQGALLDSLGGTAALGMIGRQVEVDAAQVTTRDGTPAPSGSVVKGAVDGIRYTTDGPMLTIGNYEFPYGAVVAVRG